MCVIGTWEYAVVKPPTVKAKKIEKEAVGKEMENALEDGGKLYAFFYETVVCRYAEYKTIRKERKAGTRVDLKAAIDAATAAYHFREHLPNPHHKTKTFF